MAWEAHKFCLPPPHYPPHPHYGLPAPSCKGDFLSGINHWISISFPGPLTPSQRMYCHPLKEASLPSGAPTVPESSQDSGRRSFPSQKHSVLSIISLLFHISTLKKEHHRYRWAFVRSFVLVPCCPSASCPLTPGYSLLRHLQQPHGLCGAPGPLG